MGNYRTGISKEEVIEMINQGKDLKDIKFLKYFKVREYADIKSTLFDKIDRKYWPAVLSKFCEECEYSPYQSVKDWYAGQGRQQLHDVEKEISQTENCDESKHLKSSIYDKRTFPIPRGRIDKIKELWQYLSATKTIDVCWETFQNNIIQADFINLYVEPNKAKIKYTIVRLSYLMGVDWKAEVCSSINISIKQVGRSTPKEDFKKHFPL